MTDGNGPAEGVQLRRVNTKVAYRLHYLAGKSLVNLDDVEIVNLHAGPGQDFLCGWDRAYPHDGGVYADGYRVSEGTHWLIAELFCLLLGHKQYRAGTITPRARVARRYQAILLIGRWESRQP